MRLIPHEPDASAARGTSCRPDGFRDLAAGGCSATRRFFAITSALRRPERRRRSPPPESPSHVPLADSR